MEIEIKSELDEPTFHAIWRSFSRLCMTTRLQMNHFFDTDDRRFLSSKWVLRLRSEEDRSFLTLKGRASICGSVYTRPEIEDEISPKMAAVLVRGFSPSDFQFETCRKTKELFGDVTLLPFMRFTNERTKIPWRSHTIELDRTSIRGAVFYELEAETDADHAESLEREIRTMFENNGWPFRPSTMSKFRRALAMYGIDSTEE
jgi:inorganic triphosphatase YgiF